MMHTVTVRLPAAFACLALALTLAARSGPVRAQGWVPEPGDAENDAIRYSRTAPEDAVARLQRALEAGTARLRFEGQRGYLQSVLRALQVPESSQVLVFSRTSFQRDLISPERPRALYFGPEVHVGWVPGGAVIELAAADPRLGAVFYTLRQAPAGRPRFERQTRACLGCHDSSFTGGVPGFLMRSVPVTADGSPMTPAESFVTSDASAMRERWGGWYVTGTTPDGVHMGNAVSQWAGHRATPDTAGSRALAALARISTPSDYPGRGSDAAALLVLGHQTHVLNLITKLGYRTRMAMAFDQARGQVGAPSSETRAVIAREAEPLVRGLLFADEASLAGAVVGRSAFVRAFEGRGPRAASGGSLHDLDLRQRLSRFPCSYLVYSTAFDGLPDAARRHVYQRLWAVLSSRDDDGFERLSRADRQNVLAILLDTKPEFRRHRPATGEEWTR